MSNEFREALKAWCAMTDDERKTWPSFENFRVEYKRYYDSEITKDVLENK